MSPLSFFVLSVSLSAIPFRSGGRHVCVGGKIALRHGVLAMQSCGGHPRPPLKGTRIQAVSTYDPQRSWSASFSGSFAIGFAKVEAVNIRQGFAW